MKSFAEWINEQTGKRIGGSQMGIRARTPYAPGRTPFLQTPDPREINPLVKFGTDIIAAPGEVLRQQSSPVLGTMGGGHDPKTLLRAYDFLKGKGMIDEDGFVQLTGQYPDHHADIPISQFCPNRQDTIEMLTHEGFSRPKDMLRRVCGHTGRDDVSSYDVSGYGGYTPVDEEWLAIEIIKRRMIEHEIRAKGMLELFDIRHPRVDRVRPFESGEDDYRIEVWVSWPIYKDELERARKELK